MDYTPTVTCLPTIVQFVPITNEASNYGALHLPRQCLHRWLDIVSGQVHYYYSYSTIAAKQVGKVAQQAEEKKMQKYKHLDSCYFFTPVAIETSGVFGPKTMEFLIGLGHRLRQVSGEANSFAYLTQRLSVAIPRGNAASVLGTMKMGSQEEEFFV